VKGHEDHYEPQRPKIFDKQQFFSMLCVLSVFVRFVFQKKLFTL